MMKPRKLTIIFLAVLLCSSLGLTGCKDTEKEKAVAEAAAAKAELSAVKVILAQSETERDNLKTSMTNLSESLKNAKSELTTIMQARDKLQAAVDQAMNVKEQLAELTKERDTAIAKAMSAQAMVDKLKGQLQEQIQKVVGLEGQNKNLQEMIDDLKEKLGEGLNIPKLP